MATGKIKGITIKLGADTSTLDKALKDVNRNSSSLNTELKQVNKLLKFDPKNTELLAQKQKILADSIGNTETKLGALKQAQGEVEKMFKSGDIGEKEYREFQRTLAETEQSLKSYQKQVKELDKTTEDSTSKLAAFSDAAKKVGGKVKNAGKALLPISGVIAGAGLASAKMSMDFEDAMAKVSTIADTSQVPLKDLEKGIKDLSDETGISSTQIADNVYNAISAGQKTGDAVNFVRSSTKLAKAGFADAGDTLNVLTSVLNAYGMEASDVTKVSDILVQTQNKGKTTVGDLSAAMGKIIPTAKANNVAFEQVAAGYAVMTSKGVATAESTTYMNSMLNELGKSGTKTSDMLKEKTGKSFSELMKSGMSLSDVLQIVSDGASEQGLAFGDMWGSAEAGKAGLILLGDSAEDFNGKLKDMQDSSGATDEAYKKMQTNSEELRKTFNEVKNAAIELGKKLMEVLGPMLQTLANKIKDFTKWFSGLDEGTKKLIVIIGIIIAVSAPILIVIGNIILVVAAVASLGSALLPVIAIIAAVIAVIVAVIAIVKNWGAITDWLSKKFAAFKDWLGGIWDAIASKISAVWNGIKDFFAGIWNAIYSVIEVPLKLIMSIISGVMYVIYAIIVTIWEVIKAALKAAWGWISSTASAIFSPLIEFFSGIWNSISGVVSKVWTAIKDTLGGIWDGIKDKAVSVFSFLWNHIKDGFKALKKTLGSIVKGIANGIISPIGGAVNGVINGVNWILKKVGSDKKFDLWKVPKFAHGTGGIKKDTIGVVNDQKGSVYKELIVPPKGQPFIAEGRDVALPLEKGTKIMPARETKDFLAGLPHFAGGIGNFFGGVWESIKDFTGSVWDYITHPSKIVQIAIDKFTDLANIAEPWISVAKGAVSSVFDGVVGFVKGIFDTQSNVNYNPSAGVEQWRGLAEKALKMTGQYSEANLERLLYQMQTESGGNPNAINNWDINAINGTPSKGLMQVIDPTFRTHALSGYDTNIYDPLSNILASIRYAVSRYGNLAAAYRGVGYENGIGDISLSDLIPSLPTIDVKWFKDGGILTQPTLFNMGHGKVGGAGEAGAEAIAPIGKLKEYIQEAVLDVLGDKDINITFNLSNVLDGEILAKKTAKYTKPIIDEMERFQNRLMGVRT